MSLKKIEPLPIDMRAGSLNSGILISEADFKWINKMIDNAVPVHSRFEKGSTWYPPVTKDGADIYYGYVIGIGKIKKETCRDVLDEIERKFGGNIPGNIELPDELIERARAALSREKE